MKLYIYSLAVLMALPCLLRAEPRAFALEDCVAYGLEHSLQLRNAAIDEAVVQRRVEAVDGAYDPRLSGQVSYSDSQVRDATSFFLDDRQVTAAQLALGKAFRSGTRVQLKAEHSHIEAGGDVSAFITDPYSSSVGLSVSQSILRNAFGELDRARRRGAEAGGAAAQLALQREAELLAGRIADAYWDLDMARMNFDTGRDSLVRAERLLATNRARVADGLIDETELLSFEALIATRRVEVLVLSNAVANASDALKNTIQLPRKEWVEVAITPPAGERAQPLTASPGPDEADASARKDLAAMAQLVMQAEAEMAMRESELRHDLQLFGELGRGSSGEDFDGSTAFDDDAWTVGVMMDVGWGRTAEKSAVAEARLLHAKARNTHSALAAAIDLEQSVARRNLVSGWERVLETRNARELQQRKLGLEQEKFEQGRSAINVILQYEDDFALASQAHNAAQAAYQKAIVQYRLARGEAPVRGVETNR